MKSEKKQISITIVSNIVNLIVSMGISFFLTPYIVRTVGSAAYGFVSLANQFVGYIQIIVVALNSMASRFITIKIHENDTEGAKTYFSSVFFSNLLISVVFVVPITFFVLYMEHLINVPVEILYDVKLLWGLVFINFLLGIVTSVFGSATYVKNRLELSSVRQIETNFIKSALLVYLFAFFRPNVAYIGFATFVSSIYSILMNIYYTKKLLPEMKVSRKYFNVKAVVELISSGVWNSLTKLSQTLLAGLDLLITNIFVGPVAMGVLSIAKTLPNVIKSFLSAVPGAFSPQFTIDYAKKDMKKLLGDIDSASKITSVISSVPLVGLAVFGNRFFTLWVPGENANLLHILSILTIFTAFVSAPLQPLYQIFTVTNKVKGESISVFVQGILSTIIVFLLLSMFKNSNIDNVELYIIAGTSTVLGTIRAITFVPIYAAYCLKIKKSTFYKIIIKSLLSFVLTFFIEKLISFIIPGDTWFLFMVAVMAASIIGLIVNIFAMLNKEERMFIKEKLLKRRRKHG